MKVKKLSEILKENPTYKPSWKVSKDLTRLYHPKFGEIERIVICDDAGNPLWDQYQISEGPLTPEGKRIPGSVVLPYYKAGGKYFLGLLYNERPIPLDPCTGKKGIISLEVPRGFALSGEIPTETAKRELGAETGKVIKKLHYLGKININTTFYETWIENYAAEIFKNKVSKFRPDATEKILRCEFYSTKEVKEMIKNDKILCGISKASILEFFLHFE